MSVPTHTSETPTRRRSTAAQTAAAAGRGSAAKPALLNGAGANVVDVLSDPRLPGITIRLELVTPELARQYLARLPGEKAKIKQRNRSAKLTERYAADMLGDNWLFIADTVRFNTLAELVDAQHRLEAIIRSARPQFFLIVEGLEPGSFAVFDTGRPRKFADVLASKGVPNAALVGAVTTRVLHWRRGNYGTPNVSRVPNGLWLGVAASPQFQLEVFEELGDEIQTTCRLVSSFKGRFAKKTAAPSVLALMYLLFSKLDLDRAESFFHQLRTGPDQSGPEYPLFVLRERLTRRIPDGQSGSPDWVWIHFFAYTWNKWLAGESLTSNLLKAPSKAAFNYVAKPNDPHVGTRPEGWEPLGGAA